MDYKDYKDKYDKLVEAVKVLQEENPSDEGIQNWVNDNVPELRESEDERIRNTLIRFHNSTIDIDGIKGYKIVSWLEKQYEKKSVWHNEDEEPQRGSLILLIMQSGTPIVAKIIEPNHTFNHGERWAYIDDLLEKQEKRPQSQWKPSDEQLEALWCAAEKYLESDNANVVELRGKVLESLYHDLKKLKGE